MPLEWCSNVSSWLTTDSAAMSLVRPLIPQQPTFEPHVRFRADCVCFTPRSRHSGLGWECLRLTQLGHSGSFIQTGVYRNPEYTVSP
jgi:hypothetical protein